jgi:hypothetical protein
MMMDSNDCIRNGNEGPGSVQYMMMDSPNFCTNSAALLDLPADAALEAWDSPDDDCPLRFHEVKSNRLLAQGKRLRPRVVAKPRAISLAKILWASPWSLWGLGIGALGLVTGGGIQKSGPVLEFWGGFLPLFLKCFPFIAGSPVATFGHVVLGRSQRHLEACRPHQLVHVKQYERWGPLFVPTYLTWWFVLWCCGKHPYYDNPFERQAYGHTT